MSIEHHVRNEATFKNVSNWKLYAFQQEQEVREGQFCSPLELINCSDMLFANLYLFRVIWVNTPYPHAIRTWNCRDIEFLNIRNFTQNRYQYTTTLYDVNTDAKVYPWDITRLYIKSGITNSAQEGTNFAQEGILTSPYPLQRGTERTHPLQRGTESAYPIQRRIIHTYSILRGTESAYPLQRGTHTYSIPRGTERTYPFQRGITTPTPPQEGNCPPPEGAGGGFRCDIFNLTGKNPPVVISDRRNGDFTIDPLSKPDYLYVGSLADKIPDIDIPLLVDIDYWDGRENSFPYFVAFWDDRDIRDRAEYHAVDILANKLKTIEADIKFLELTCIDLDNDLMEIIRKDPTIVIVLKSKPSYCVHEARMFSRCLLASGCDAPVILRCDYQETDKESLQIKAAVDFGSLLIDGIGNGVFLCNDKTEPCLTDRYMFSILQATRTRITKTEYISCPGCGRTLYNLQTTIARIKKATSHLKGLKIGIMGCIVNGPGEMADADYGYVGAGRGRISLYQGKVCVLQNIPEEEAVEQLVELIKANGDWK
jgi:hypothetical protein